MTTFTALLACGTVGTVDSDTLAGQHLNAFIGDIVTVHLRDENGEPLEVEGELVAVLED